jgi:hypothetical protein
VFARQPFGWPPDVVRRQKVRDLLLILEAAKGWN